MAYYFASDLHLGLTYRGQSPLARERLFVRWLDQIAPDCQKLFLVGDVFDFWYEWSHVVPAGFVRVLGRLAALADSGVEIHFMIGNHDMWAGDYLSREIGMVVHTAPYVFDTESGRRIFVDHSHALGEHDFWGRTMLRLFTSHTARWLFSHLLHPNWAMTLGKGWSNSSRHARQDVAHTFGNENERIVKYARTLLSQGQKIDYFIVGHLHTPILYPLTPNSCLVVLGQWITDPQYARLDPSSGEIQLLSYELNS